MTQEEVEKQIIGMWQNLENRHLWNFRLLDDGGRSGIISDDSRPVRGRVFWWGIVFVDEDNIFLDLEIGGIRTQHQIKFLSDNAIEIYKPMGGNADGAQSGLEVLHRASP